MGPDSQAKKFPRRYRLTNAKDYRYVFAEPFRTADPAFTILARQNDLAYPRLGVIVSKKDVSKAVQRNRLKRIVRESFRSCKHVIGPLDVVVICKKNSVNKLRSQLFRQLQKHWIYLSEHAE